MAFVDEDGGVLRPRHVATVDGPDEVADEVVEEVWSVGWQRLTEGDQLFACLLYTSRCV